MCAVSYVGDYYANSFPQRWPTVTIPGFVPNPTYTPNPQVTTPGYVGTTIPSYVTQSQFDALLKEVQELKELLLAAKKFDEATGQPECHMDEKVDLIKKVAKLVGVDMKDIFPD